MCVNSLVRLVDGGSPWTGRLEVFHAGQWGTVCSSGFTSEDANVTCAGLGYAGTEVKIGSPKVPAPSSRPVWLQSVACAGTGAPLKPLLFVCCVSASRMRWQVRMCV